MKTFVYYLAAATLLLFFSNCEPEVVIEPRPCFTIDGYPEMDAPITFLNCSADAQSYHWSFGDGSYSNEVSPTHFYEAGGNYTVQLTATHGQTQVAINKTLEVYAKVPTSVTIKTLVIRDFPGTNNGQSWDANSGADIFPVITDEFSDPVYYAKAYFTDSEPGTPYAFIPDPQVNIGYLNDTYSIDLYDSDVPNDPELMISVPFVPMDHHTYNSNKVEIQTANFGVFLEVEWNY